MWHRSLPPLVPLGKLQNFECFVFQILWGLLPLASLRLLHDLSLLGKINHAWTTALASPLSAVFGHGLAQEDRQTLSSTSQRIREVCVIRFEALSCGELHHQIRTTEAPAVIHRYELLNMFIGGEIHNAAP
jgi:hypothetical protein